LPLPPPVSVPDGEKRHPSRSFAHILLGVGLLLLLSIGGEVVARAVELPLPGSVLGLAVLVLVLLSPIGGRVEKIIGRGADALIVMLPLLLVPLAVGVLEILATVGGAVVGLVVSVVVGWLAAFAATAALYVPFRRRTTR
jgi:holin-like protein